MMGLIASLKGSIALLGVGGIAALWVIKAVLGLALVRWWKARRAARV
ncbi:hypothetical protein ACN2XU_03865 [Primorskyibacter sp. 2E107]